MAVRGDMGDGAGQLPPPVPRRPDRTVLTEEDRLFVGRTFQSIAEHREVLAFATKRYGPLVLPHPRFLAPLLAVWGLAMLMLVLQRDLGSALFYFGTALIMTYIASGKKSFFAWGGGLFILGTIASYIIFPHI